MCCFISVCIQYPNKRQSPDEEREKRRSINKSLFPKSQTQLFWGRRSLPEAEFIYTDSSQLFCQALNYLLSFTTYHLF